MTTIGPALTECLRFQVCHPGELEHKGVAITRGRRVLLVGFMQDRRRVIFDRPRENSLFEMQLVRLDGLCFGRCFVLRLLVYVWVDIWVHC